MNTIPSIKRALISVSDKTGIIEFAKHLVDAGVEIISTGGTSQALKGAGILHKQVDEITKLPEMLDGRVKTLHPLVHGGILGKRDQHREEMSQHGIQGIDLVVVNFYPFEAAIAKNKKMSWSEAVEYIDIGGPTMVRAAAKNFAWVTVLTDPNDYASVVNEIQATRGLTFDSRKRLAEKAFALTSHYDAMIQQYFLRHDDNNCAKQSSLNLQLEKVHDLRYGENPHQKASAYQFRGNQSGLLGAIQHQGKPLSYNNLLDAEAALNCVKEFSEPTCVIVKHANPCGVASAETIDEAYQSAYAADSLSAFGGIIALNRPCTKNIATAIAAIFMEVVIAPAYTDEALAVLMAKPNLRVLAVSANQADEWELRFITGGVLMQERDSQLITETDLQVVTKTKPSASEIQSMLFAWRVLKHIKSNGILIAKNQMTIGIGAGQVSRIDAVELAIRKAQDNMTDTVLASDAFFPFRDSIDRIANTGVRAIVQPGGSVRDEEVIAACDEHGLAMVFTGKRCFRH